MSGLKNVLGNVYGDPDDRPTQPDLDDVQDSIDALAESVDPASETADEPAHDEPSALDALDDWIDDLDDGSYESDDTSPGVDDDPLAAFAEPALDDVDDVGSVDDLSVASDDDPWAMIDGISDDLGSSDLDDSAGGGDPSIEDLPSSVDQTSTDSNTTAETSDDWLSVVDGGDAGDDWMSEYDDVGSGGESPSEDVPMVGFEDFELDTGDDEVKPTDTTQIAAALAADATDDAAPAGEEAWLDDLFTVDDPADEPAADAAPISPSMDETTDELSSFAEQLADTNVPEAAPTPAFDDDAQDLLGSVTAAINTPAPAPTLAPAAAPGGFDTGWNRADDDILPAGGGGGRGRKKRGRKDDVAIEIDTHQLDRLAALPTPPNAAPETIGAPAATMTMQPPPMGAPNAGMAPLAPPVGMVPPPPPGAPADLTASGLDGALQADDPVHLFAPDADLDEAAGKRGRRGRKAKAPKEPKAKKAKKESKKGRRGRKGDDGNDAALMAQVDAAIASQAAPAPMAPQVVPTDGFWGETVTPAAAPVEPQQMAGMADPLDVELLQPPTSFDPGPVID